MGSILLNHENQINPKNHGSGNGLWFDRKSLAIHFILYCNS